MEVKVTREDVLKLLNTLNTIKHCDIDERVE